jgi:aspartate aminotransferase, mitochondrial
MLARSVFKGFSFWKNVPQGPPDPILGISEAFRRDTSPKKVNLGVGAYRDDNNKPWVLPSVRQAEDLILKTPGDHEYLPIEGLESFNTAAIKLAYDKSPAITDKRIAACQSLSGTGALRLGMAYIKKFYTKSNTIYIPNPTWGNHKTIAKDSGLEWKEYSYYNPDTFGLNFKGMTQDIEKAPDGSIILLHACAHNPTGVDLTPQEWDELYTLISKKNHLVFFDSAYQGFASGDIDKDAYGPRKFLSGGTQILLAQSFAKNFGLYGERIGCFSAVCIDTDEKDRVLSQIKILARPMYSNPPLYGSKIVSTVLNTPALYQQWLKDVKTMADRIIVMRSELVNTLKKSGSTRDWSHITKQIGMFAFTGLNPQQSQRLMNEFHVYLTMDGRISLAGLNSHNVQYVGEAIYNVTN